MRTLLSLATVAFLACGAAARADENADIQKIVNKAIKAHGGEANLNKYQAVSIKMKGKFYGTGEGIDFTAESKAQEPDKYRIDITGEIAGSKFELIQAVDSDKGWKSTNGAAEDLTKEELAAQKEEMYAGQVGRLTPLMKKGYKLSSLGEKKVGERVAFGVKVSHEGRRDIMLYFDKETGLLALMERRVKDVAAGQEFTQETLYEDFKAIDGVQQPHKVTVNRDGKKYIEGEITEFKHLEELDASTFAKP